MAASYTLYCLDAHGQISLAESIHAEDDEDALRQAQALKQDALMCEVWQDSCLVARLDAQDLLAS